MRSYAKKIFMSSINALGELQTDNELIFEAKEWISNNTFRYKIKDIKRHRVRIKLVIAVYYEEK